MPFRIIWSRTVCSMLMSWSSGASHNLFPSLGTLQVLLPRCATPDGNICAATRDSSGEGRQSCIGEHAAEGRVVVQVVEGTYGSHHNKTVGVLIIGKLQVVQGLLLSSGDRACFREEESGKLSTIIEFLLPPQQGFQQTFAARRGEALFRGVDGGDGGAVVRQNRFASRFGQVTSIVPRYQVDLPQKAMRRDKVGLVLLYLSEQGYAFLPLAGVEQNRTLVGQH